MVYIIGAGRSGTTLLDIILGNTNHSISLGEINRFFKRKGIPPLREPKSATHAFWSKIKEEFDTELDCPDYESLDKLTHRFDYHASFFKRHLNSDKLIYFGVLQSLYNAILKNTDKNILIESSKYPSRALNMTKALDKNKFRIVFIYLKKDPVRVVRSFRKKNIEQPSKSFFAANIYYLVVNLLCEWAVRKLSKSHLCYKLNYDDFLTRPALELGKMSEALQLDLSECIQKLEKTTPLETGFLFDGNRIRLKETLLLQSTNNGGVKSIGDFITRIINYIVYR